MAGFAFRYALLRRLAVAALWAAAACAGSGARAMDLAYEYDDEYDRYGEEHAFVGDDDFKLANRLFTAEPEIAPPRRPDDTHDERFETYASDLIGTFDPATEQRFAAPGPVVYEEWPNQEEPPAFREARHDWANRPAASDLSPRDGDSHRRRFEAYESELVSPVEPVVKNLPAVYVQPTLPVASPVTKPEPKPVPLLSVKPGRETTRETSRESAPVIKEAAPTVNTAPKQTAKPVMKTKAKAKTGVKPASATGTAASNKKAPETPPPAKPADQLPEQPARQKEEPAKPDAPKDETRPSGDAPAKPEFIKPKQEPKSLMDDLLCGMIAVTPAEFEKPVETVPFALKQVASSVLRGNRTIQVAAYRPEQARADIMTAKSVYDPEMFGSMSFSRTETEPGISIGGAPKHNTKYQNQIGRAGIRQHMPSGGNLTAYREWNNGTERPYGSTPERGHGGAFVVEMSQPLLNGFADAENRTLIRISRLQADISEEEFRQTVIETMTKALEAYWQVVLAREEVRINRESLDMAERLLERELGRKNEGISTQLDVDRAREAAATRAFNVRVAMEQHQQAQENLKYLLNDKSVPVGMDVFVEPVENFETQLARANLDKSITTALENRPEFQNADLAIRRSEARRDFAKHSLLPELNLVGSIRRNDKDSNAPTASSSTLNTGTDWTVGMEFAMPIGNMKARSNVRKAESEVSQMIEEKKNVRDYIITEVRTVVKNIDLVVREIPLNHRAREAAVKVLEGEWAKLELNQTGNRDLLQAQDLVSVTDRNYVNSFIRYNIYLVRLFAAEGTLLDKMGIALK